MSYAEAQYTVDEVLAGIRKATKIGPEPNNLKNLNLIGEDSKVFITFEATDTYFKSYDSQEDQLIISVAGVIVRRKEGSMPEDENDGDLVGIFKDEELHAYANKPFIDTNVVNGTEYFYRFFPYSNHGMVNRNIVNSGSITPKVPKIWGFHHDFTNLDPMSCITYIESAKGYKPMFSAVSNWNNNQDEHTNGTWEDWLWFKKLRPFAMIGGSSTDIKQAKLCNPNYGIDETNFRPSSDPTKHDYDMFVWFPKLYMKEVYAEDGNSRDVYFALEKDGDTADFIPVGFIDSDNNELEGVWIGCYYMDILGRVVSNRNHANMGHTKTIADSMSLVTSRFGDRARALGGPLMHVIRDLLFMLFRSTDTQSTVGYGYSGRYNNTETTTYGHSGSGAMGNSSKTIHKFFYGAHKSSSSNMGVKAFCTASILSQDYFIVDPYTISYGSILCISPNYKAQYANADIGASSPYVRTNVKLPVSAIYPNKMVYLGDGLGSAPDGVTNSTSNTGLCDMVSAPSGGTYGYHAMRCGYNGYTDGNGISYIYCGVSSGGSDKDRVIVPLVLPMPGYEPTIVDEGI